MTASRTLAAALALAALAGCSGGTGLYPVRGRVTHAGRPAAGALVYFHPRGDASLTAVRPTAATGPDGAFDLACNLGPGSPPGEYDVTVTWPNALLAPGGEADYTDRLKGRYANARTSGLAATVRPETNVLPPFDLK